MWDSLAQPRASRDNPETSTAQDVSSVITASTPLLIGIGDLIAKSTSDKYPKPQAPPQPPPAAPQGVAGVPTWALLLVAGLGLVMLARN